MAKSGGRVVAFGSVHTSRLLHHCGEVAEIQELFVLPEARGKGIGTALVEAMAAWAKEMDAVQLEVASNSRREETHEFYESIGFEFTHKKFVRPMR